MFDEKVTRLGTNSIKWDRYNNEDIIAMGTADMDFMSPPSVTEALISRAKVGMFAYELISDSYYNAIIDWYAQMYNWNIKKEWLSSSPGIWAGIRICIDSFTMPGDKIIVHSPTFHPIIDIIEQSGRSLVTNSLVLKDGYYSLDFEDFENKIANNVKMFILINPQNPSGRVFTNEELIRIGEICNKYKVLVISDEVHGGVVFVGHKHIPYASISEEFAKNSIVITAASKAFNLQGMTHGILIIPNKHLRNIYQTALTGYDFDFATNVFSLAAVEAAYRYGRPWLDELITYLQCNLLYLIEYFEVNIPKIKVIKPEGSYMVWLDCRELKMNEDELETFFMIKAKVALTFGSSFGKDGEGFVRINIACSRNILKEALERIKGAVNSII
ncbi:pyridoxal phosphate-dependent aminotransferase [Clostridium malenominatum]|uniref:cysteine-S-conjugate beta-lyase n=2 Tax=Clostridium malenominatum TaxID=1539 RepID=A0ABP3UG17_9CLOT